MPDDQFLTPAIPIRRPPRELGPKVLIVGPSTDRLAARVRDDLETFVNIRFTDDAEDAEWIYGEYASWLAAIVELTTTPADGMTLAEALHEGEPTLPLLLIAPSLPDSLLLRALAMGATVVPEDGPVDDAVLTFLQRAVRLRATAPDGLVRRLMSLYELTVTQARVVRLALSGEPRAAIAEMLDISPKTYDRHAENIREKTGRSLRSLREAPIDELIAELEAKEEKAGRGR